MKLSLLSLFFSLPLVIFPALPLWFSASAQTAEDTLLLCQGDTRTTARIYQVNGTLNMRLYDRQDQVVWLRSPAQSETNPEVVIYSNLRGEQTIQVSANRNDPTLCSIQVGNQPLERGTVLTP